jgi:hypothetical protein
VVPRGRVVEWVLVRERVRRMREGRLRMPKMAADMPMAVLRGRVVSKGGFGEGGREEGLGWDTERWFRVRSVFEDQVQRNGEEAAAEQ